jgi:hypothetical protein
MKPTRREFLITSTTAMCAMSFGVPSFAAAHHPARPFLLEGDPYTAHVDEHGLGGRTWDDAYAHALRFRGTPDQRDHYVLGLEL